MTDCEGQTSSQSPTRTSTYQEYQHTRDIYQHGYQNQETDPSTPTVVNPEEACQNTYTPSYRDYSSSSASFTPQDAYDEGYERGYEQGEEDGAYGHGYEYGYDDSNDYYDVYDSQYCEGYADGYNTGYYDNTSD